MNIEKLRKLQNRLLKQAKTPEQCRFNMKYFLDSTKRIMRSEGYCVASEGKIPSVLQQPACGTQACLAGEAVIMERKAKFDKEHGYFVFYGSERDTAAEILGLTYEQKKILFYFKEWNGTGFKHLGWPDDLQKAYESAKTGMERALIGAARLERFIQTNGKE